MSARSRVSKRLAIAAAILAVPYCVAFHIGTMRSRAAEDFGKQGFAPMGVARLAGAYASSHNGEMPPMDAAHERFAFSPGVLPVSYRLGKAIEYPMKEDVKYLLVGPVGRHGALTLEPGANPADYIYLPYAVASEEEAMALLDAVNQGANTDTDISLESGKGTLGSRVFYRFRRDLHKKLAADGVIPQAEGSALAQFPMLIQRPHDGHSWVVFADNHVEYLPYPGPFPLTQSFIAAVQ